MRIHVAQYQACVYGIEKDMRMHACIYMPACMRIHITQHGTDICHIIIHICHIIIHILRTAQNRACRGTSSLDPKL